MEWSLKNKESSKLKSGRWLSPLVGDQKRVGRDMIVVIEIIAGRLMRHALTRQGCQRQIVTVLETNKGLPSGATGCQLEVGLTGSNEYSKQAAAYR